ncbi:hypothetical protein AU468_08630 [Alkalispirochaeta sphaeroplastigenens]|uniref:DUF2802 domain-containing protein n=2 Tax=Alkalispirochaeta sphaeroplastigenens TaxID=1187066 RepID=A0A2S4JNM9_9SPIO|nr:hypothetical protein AU468_08630 [Alkalispirochaeta sphaeroplastigenens]
MTFGMYLLTTTILFTGFALWLRGVVIARVRPERILEDLSREVQALVADLDRTSDHHISLLEDRISTLSGLLDRADRQIDDARMLLEHLQARPPSEPWGGAVDVSSPTAGSPGGARAIPERGPDRPGLPHGASPAGEGAGARGITTGRAGHYGDVPPGENLSEHISGDASEGELLRERNSFAEGEIRADSGEPDQRARVIELYNQGLSSDLIAARTGIAIGEVELIISLREKRLWR